MSNTATNMTVELTPAGVVVNVEPPVEAGRQLETKALTLSERAALLKIEDQPSYDVAVDVLKGIKALRNEAEAHHRPTIDLAHKTHKSAVEALKRVDVPLEQAERLIKGTMAAWTIEQERIRRAEENRLRLEAAKAHEAQERIRRAEEERLRLEQEKAREDELEQQIELAEAEGADETEVLAMIEQAAMAQPLPPPPPIVLAPPPPTVAPVYKPAAGVAVRKTFAAEVTNLRQLIQHVAQHPDLEYLLAADLPKLNQLARMQGAGLRIPGVRVIEKSSVAVR